MSICRENPNYYFSKKDLAKMKQHLRLNRCLTQEVLKLFNLYEDNHLIRDRNHKIYFYHPNIKINYFENIDTKQKAYFLGLIFADGSISYKSNNRLTFEIGFSLKDKILLLKLSKIIGFENKYIRKRKERNFWRISINSNGFCKHLIRHGMIVGKRKTYHIKLPRFHLKTLYLAFLLGFFDGDGTANTTRITTASLLFLKQLKHKFKIQYNPKKVESLFKVKNKIYKGCAYIMYIGGNLINELLDNYSESLQRKRKRFSSYDQRLNTKSMKNFHKKIKHSN
ncbi:MAG: LAGLIDADG family homing endonuclease [Promethearchaeota archaeon]